MAISTSPAAICSAMTALLEVDNLSVRFPVMGAVKALVSGAATRHIDAVADVSFSVPAGTTFGLVGESGSGKTTLGRAIIGLVQPSAGSIRFEGKAAPGTSDRELKPWRREIAMMFQDPVASLSPRLPVRSLITEPFRIHGLPDRDLDVEARRLLDMVGLPAGFAGRYPHELSGGQARRVGVARALALSPKLIIADEPTAGLDVSVQGEILNLLARLQRELGLTYLIITHNLAVVRHVCDQVAIMYLGRFVEEGPTAAVFKAASHPYTSGLIAAQPEPDPDKRRESVELTGEVPSLRNRPSGCEFHTRCPRVQERCRIEAPRLVGHGLAHRVSCHFPLT
ncbi:MAG: peptide/nickel transport system ATP-binding protein [Rhodospirillaceae bacterium]|jgi:oligopeptide/dipeptide ABC transporter ATP-binding protein|nr:peptide/nickel transport system ATP-binding protein [Rhodospirillaceae bacterium]